VEGIGPSWLREYMASDLVILWRALVHHVLQCNSLRASNRGRIGIFYKFKMQTNALEMKLGTSNMFLQKKNINLFFGGCVKMTP
jgi:hypothetical protein